jgi:hypothetical protein
MHLAKYKFWTIYIDWTDRDVLSTVKLVHNLFLEKKLADIVNKLVFMPLRALGTLL